MKDDFLSDYLKEYYFELDESLIAKYPVSPRDHSNLMIVKKDQIIHEKFFNIIDYLPQNSILVFNKTKVSNRRVYLYKNNKKKFEVLFLENEKNIWKTLIRNGKKIKLKEVLSLDNYSFVLEKKEEGFYYLSCWFNSEPVLTEKEEGEKFFQKYGNIPIPPYLKRNSEKIDEVTYQTVFAEKTGSVASPTASLHFTEDLFLEVQKKFKVLFLNLEIGYGTFAPLQKKNFINQELHQEFYEIPKQTAEILNLNFQKNPIIAVGTTTLRALEDNYRKFKKFESGYFSTKIFLKPPDVIQTADYLITNFHLPSSSLFLLVCAFSGTELIKKSYQKAIEKRYRFYSYGDAMLLFNYSKNFNK